MFSHYSENAFLSIFSNKGYKQHSDQKYTMPLMPHPLIKYNKLHFPPLKEVFNSLYWMKGGAHMTQLQANIKEKINP